MKVTSTIDLALCMLEKKPYCGVSFRLHLLFRTPSHLGKTINLFAKQKARRLWRRAFCYPHLVVAKLVFRVKI